MIWAGRSEASFWITPDLFFHLSCGETARKLQGLYPSLFGVLVFFCFFFSQSSILYTSLYTCQSQSPNSGHPIPLHRSFPPLVSICLFSTSVSQLLPCNPVHLYHFSRFHIHALIYNICFSLSDLLHSV